MNDALTMKPLNPLTPVLAQVLHSVTTYDEAIDRAFRNCLVNTWETTVHRLNGKTFVITGDIPALWLRDSAAQVRPYIFFARHDAELARAVQGLVAFHAEAVLTDPWANAFNRDLSIWEQKYELDSLCYVIRLAHDLAVWSGSREHFTATFRQALDCIVRHLRQEQQHQEGSYRHHELARDGIGAPAAVTGMAWSGFRPSDDACTYPYLVPANMFASVALEWAAEIYRDVYGDAAQAAEALRLSREIRGGIERHGRYYHPEFGWIWAYEVDGLGNANLMDDANIPSLLSAPYLGYCPANDPLYQNTRRFVLSTANPYFRQGRFAKGVGSPHTDQYGVPGSVWHLALGMQALTSCDPAEVRTLIRTMVETTAGTYLMHEGFHPDDPSRFSRPWFAWANSLFAETVLTGWFGLRWSREEGLRIAPAGPGAIEGEGIPFGHLRQLRVRVVARGPVDGRTIIAAARVNGERVSAAPDGVHIPLTVEAADVEIQLAAAE